ncbi:hypothetical protein KIMH_13010 [Bombiscardovia apis]|uniref:Uncharacterized protein n=1 Tax=Bombiscardovia apis TaxID=2932182 RepID=A0ABN6SKF2_9BIFI|nr:hypothetical protein KIMH_13010 [Bombiscardovia apis]
MKAFNKGSLEVFAPLAAPFCIASVKYYVWILLPRALSSWFHGTIADSAFVCVRNLSWELWEVENGERRSAADTAMGSYNKWGREDSPEPR